MAVHHASLVIMAVLLATAVTATPGPRRALLQEEGVPIVAAASVPEEVTSAAPPLTKWPCGIEGCVACDPTTTPKTCTSCKTPKYYLMTPPGICGEPKSRHIC